MQSDIKDSRIVKTKNKKTCFINARLLQVMPWKVPCVSIYPCIFIFCLLFFTQSNFNNCLIEYKPYTHCSWMISRKMKVQCQEWPVHVLVSVDHDTHLLFLRSFQLMWRKNLCCSRPEWVRRCVASSSSPRINVLAVSLTAFSLSSNFSTSWNTKIIKLMLLCWKRHNRELNKCMMYCWKS